MKYIKSRVIINENSNEYINWDTIDLYALYDELNALLFNNELQKGEIKKIKSKLVGGRLKSTRINGIETWDVLEISTTTTKTLQQLKNLLAHEMIHVKLLNKKDFGGYHGTYFQREMNRINDNFKEFNVTLKDTTEINNDIYSGETTETYFLIRSDGTEDISILVLGNDIKDIILDKLETTAKMWSKKSDISITIFKTKLKLIRKFKKITSIKALKGLYGISYPDYLTLVENSEVVDGRDYKNGNRVIEEN